MRNFSFHQHLLKALVSFIALVLLCGGNSGHAIRLNPNGGYDIVIGVEDNTMEPLNVLDFLDEIRDGVQQFSTELWKTTHRRFFINSVDVIVPGNWWTLNNFDTATWQTLHGSEIRISHDVGAPNVVNPNPCGVSGLYVELPDTFFKVPRGGHYGPIGKALVNLWARYRFGVWEEHGIPGDTKFPYFYAHPSFEPKWEATGCSNEEILGSFRNIDGEVSDRCDAYSSESPDDDCRFIPSPSNTANSSLMHLHWLDSVSEFCDSKTHNYVAPNRHNLFCGHRSVWEVIRESDDYKSTKTCMDSVSRPQFRVLKESRSPEFYILLDRGRTVTPEKVLKEVMGALVQFVSYPTLERVNIAVGTYPHANQGRNHYYVKEEVGWAPISSVIYDIQRVLDESSNTDGPVIRDFGLAIQEVAEKIKQRNHLAGTVILVIKRGASPNVFDKISFEQEVLGSIKEDSRIKVFAIEAQQGEKTPYTNLQTLVEATMGQYHLINDTVNTAKKLEGILSKVQEKLEQSSIMNSLSSWTIQKEYTETDTTIEIPIYDNANMVKVHLTTSRQMLASYIYLEQLTGEPATWQLTEKGEWDENSDLTRRTVFTYTINNPAPGSIWSLRHGCHTEKVNECRFFLVVTAHNDRPTPRVSDLIFNSQSITIDVSTSAGESSFVDMSDQGLKVVPFAIYAKIEMTQQRVLGLKNVTALVRLGGNHDNHLGDWIIPLSDDGLGLPDIAEHDGIYSGIFTPPEDGLYQISVSANGVSEPSGVSTFQDLRIVNHAGGLMQINQQSFGCKNSSKLRCTSAVPRGSFSRVQDIKRTVAVENAVTFKPGKPTKILDFTVTTLPNYNVEFEFTSPRLLGSDDDPEEFLIYMAPHVDNFIGSTELTKLLVNTRGEPSGSHVKIKFNAASKAIPFYAVEAAYRGQKGGPSNVVGAVPSEEGSIVPSPITTTPSPSIPPSSTVPTTGPTTTTIPPSTSIPPSSTVPTTGPTTTTEYPWPTTTPTTEWPYPTTTEESEETDYPTDFSTSTTTTESSGTTGTSSSTTVSPSTTTDNSGTTSTSSSTTESPSTTTDNGATSTSSSTTESPSTTTDNGSTSTSSSTTESPSTTTDNGATSTSSSTTESPTTTTNNSSISSTTSSTTETPSTTTDQSISSSSTTESPSTTTDNEATGTSSSTTELPTTTTDQSISSSSTTESPSTTTDNGATTELPSTSSTDNSGASSTSSSTTESPTTTTDQPEPTTPEDGTTTSSSTTEVPVTTTDNGATTELPSSSTDNSGTSTSLSTSESPTTTTDQPEPTTPEDGTTTSSSTTEVPVTTTDNGATTELPSSSTDNSGTSTSSSTSESPTTTTDQPEPTTPEDGTTTSSSTTEVPVTTTDNGATDGTTSSSTTEVPVTTTDNGATDGTTSSSTTEVPVTTTDSGSISSSTPDEDVSNSPTSSAATTSDLPSSSLSTSGDVSNPSTAHTESSGSSSFKLVPSDALLFILTLSLFNVQRQFW